MSSPSQAPARGESQARAGQVPAAGATRRRFLRLALWAGGGLVAGGALLYGFGRERAGDAYRRLVELADAPVGPLSAEELAALMATTDTLLPEGIERDRYEDFFRYHAENVPGKKRLYERYLAICDKLAKRTGAESFAAASLEVKREVLSRAGEVRATLNAGDRLGGLRLGLFSRDWLRFERFIIREILTLFARTDGWILSGYGDPPGVPRGLDRYLRAPGAESE